MPQWKATIANTTTTTTAATTPPPRTSQKQKSPKEPTLQDLQRIYGSGLIDAAAQHALAGETGPVPGIFAGFNCLGGAAAVPPPPPPPPPAAGGSSSSNQQAAAFWKSW